VEITPLIMAAEELKGRGEAFKSQIWRTTAESPTLFPQRNLEFERPTPDQHDCRMPEPPLQCLPFWRLPWNAYFTGVSRIPCPFSVVSQSFGSKFMVYRPRTKAKLAKKTKRCPKCGKIVRGKVRCKTCHMVQK
jgi:hypothetical protein